MPDGTNSKGDFKGAVEMDVYRVTGETVKTRWGSWEITHVEYADEGETIVTRAEKDIVVEQGESLSAQNHFGRGEVYQGVSGVTMLLIGTKIVELKPGDEAVIPRGVPHASWVPSDAVEPGVFHEIQEGPNCTESDIARVADRRKLDLPHLLNPSQPDRDPKDVMLDLLMNVTIDRLKTEGVCDGYHENDFMPEIINLIDGNIEKFDDESVKASIVDFFKGYIDEHAAMHAKYTPLLKPEVETQIRAELRVA